MHSSSVLNLERFFKIYLKKFNNPTILDYGGASHDNKTTALTVLEKHYSNYKYLSLDINISNGEIDYYEYYDSFTTSPYVRYKLIHKIGIKLANTPLRKILIYFDRFFGKRKKPKTWWAK